MVVNTLLALVTSTEFRTVDGADGEGGRESITNIDLPGGYNDLKRPRLIK